MGVTVRKPETKSCGWGTGRESLYSALPTGYTRGSGQEKAPVMTRSLVNRHFGWVAIDSSRRGLDLEVRFECKNPTKSVALPGAVITNPLGVRNDYFDVLNTASMSASSFLIREYQRTILCQSA
jgi:hypothetical protein